MKEPFWLTREVLDEIHKEQLEIHGGAHGTRDDGLLDSALNRAKQAFYYGQSETIELAALYAHGLCKNRPYIDGNKRTAFLAAYTFFGLNGLQLTATEPEATVAMLAFAAGEIDETGFAAWLRDHTEER